MRYARLENVYGGKLSQSFGNRFMPVKSPLTGSLLTEVPLSNKQDLDAAVQSAVKVLPIWRSMPIKERVQVFFRYKQLLQEHMAELAALIREECGKTIGEAEAEIEKSIELTEFACSLPQLVAGEVLTVSQGIDCSSEFVPVGIVASIAPFNFPCMVPNWTIPNAIALGNCMILKPSEKVPMTANRIADLLRQAGLPDGVFNVIHGDQEIVKEICAHPDIEAISFVGSTAVAKQVYRLATNHLKRCLALGGAKNHLVVLPDAVTDISAKNIVASMSGCAGQRCMAASAMIGVGPVDHIVDRICEEARRLIPGKDVGAVISLESKKRIEKYITGAETMGAKILVDGRNVQIPGQEDGYFVGPTVIDQVTPDMDIARDEVFGPVICIMRTGTIEEAIRIENDSPYGNATSVYTQNGASARKVMTEASSGMIGVNVGVPVPREPFSFGGWNESKFGAGDITGKSSIGFWTKLKKKTIKWNAETGSNWMS